MFHTQILSNMWHAHIKDIAVEQYMPVADCIFYCTVHTPITVFNNLKTNVAGSEKAIEQTHAVHSLDE